MNYIDFHCDTLSRIYYGHDKEFAGTIWNNNGHLDLTRMKETGYLAQFFACFLHKESPSKNADHYGDALDMIKLMKTSLAENDSAKLALSYPDYLSNKKNGKISCFLTIEEGGIIENDMSRLENLYKEGVRLITLTWNFENSLGFPNVMSKEPNTGLKLFGIEVVKRMEELGMLVDVSHLSDMGFWDVAGNTKKPFVASHSCCRELCEHPRNLTDDMLRNLGERQGLVGINFCGAFLQKDGVCTLDSLVKHLRHIINVGGLDIAALGTDFDGIRCELEIPGCEYMPRLDEALLANGFLPSEVDAICTKNAERILQLL